MDDPRDVIARLIFRVDELERRVATLERVTSPVAAPAAEAAYAAPEPPPQAPDLPPAVGVFPVIGRAMLGIAGAYLLRALAESGVAPQIAVALLALAYAAAWLIGAARVPSEARFARFAYITTAVLILAPMLWELTMRFAVLSTPATAAVLAVFPVAAVVLAWKRDLGLIAWTATLAAAVTALALMLATHDLVPFLFALLAIIAATELAASRDRWLWLRVPLAAAINLPLWMLLYIYSNPEAKAQGAYAELPPLLVLLLGCLPFAFYALSILYRTTVQRHRVTWFELAQAVAVFLTAAYAILHFGGASAAMLLGVLCFLLAAVCFAIAFGYVEKFPEHRNYYVYASWGVALLLAGSFLCLPPLLLTFALCTAAIVATLLGARKERLSLEFHGLVYLAAAAYVSGLLEYAGAALAGTFPAVPGWTVWIVAVTAVACYAIGGGYRVELWNQKVLQLLSAILAVAAIIVFLLSALVWIESAMLGPGAHQLAVIRTLITCAVALGLAFSGARWDRRELVWTAYGVLALVTAKLLMEDLQEGHPGSTAMSLFLYAVALILVPRMARVGRRN